MTNRPFSSLTEMNEELISRWNSVVGTGDTVIHLGDFGFGSVGYLQSIKDRLNGEILLVRGNHDGTKARAMRIFGQENVRDSIAELDKSISMHHRPDDPNDWTFSYVFHGHSHNKTPRMSWRNNTLYVNLSVEHWNYTPVEYNQLMKEIADFESQIQEA